MYIVSYKIFGCKKNTIKKLLQKLQVSFSGVSSHHAVTVKVVGDFADGVFH